MDLLVKLHVCSELLLGGDRGSINVALQMQLQGEIVPLFKQWLSQVMIDGCIIQVG